MTDKEKYKSAKGYAAFYKKRMLEKAKKDYLEDKQKDEPFGRYIGLDHIC